jgi:large subunit ribosomal protein L25
MEELLLKAQVRPTGKTAVRQLRKKALIPAVYYTEHGEVHHIAVDNHEFLRMISKGAPLLNLRLGDEELPCIIREIQRHPVNDKVLHVDFFGVERGHRLRVKVPLRLVGSPEGVKEGGILEHSFREVEIECLPGFLPSFLEADISHLKIGDSLRIENLSFENVTLLDDAHTVVAHVAHPRLEEVAPAKPEAAEAEEPAEPEVIKARRAEEEEEKPKEKSKEK